MTASKNTKKGVGKATPKQQTSGGQQQVWDPAASRYSPSGHPLVTGGSSTPANVDRITGLPTTMSKKGGKIVYRDVASDPSQFAAATASWRPGGLNTNAPGTGTPGGGAPGAQGTQLMAAYRQAGTEFANLPRGTAVKNVQAYLQQLQSQGLTGQQATQYLYQEFENMRGGRQLQASGQWAVPSTPGKAPTGAQIVQGAFGQSLPGQLQTEANDPRAQAAYALNTVLPQTIQTNYQNLLSVADQYDAAGKKGSTLLTSLGLTRTNMGIPVGTPMSGDAIRAAASHQMMIEEQALNDAQSGTGPIPTKTLVYDWLTAIRADRTQQKDTQGMMPPRDQANWKAGSYLSELVAANLSGGGFDPTQPFGGGQFDPNAFGTGSTSTSGNIDSLAESQLPPGN